MNYKKPLLGVLFASLVLACSARADITSGLVLYLPLNETSGTTAVDASPSGYNATYINPPGDESQWTSGWLGGGLGINNSYLTIPTNAAGLYLSSGKHFTLAAWVKMPNQVNGSAIISTGYGGGGEQYDLDVSANKFRIVTRPTVGGTSVAVSSAAVLSQNNWHHVVAAWDGTGSNMTLYVNGQVSATSTTANRANLATVCVSTNPVTIGSRLASSDPTSYTLGLTSAVVDEVRIYNRTLTASDVFELYSANGRLPQFTTAPRSVTNYVGDSTLFSVAIDNFNSTLPVSYRWLSNGVVIPNATNTSLFLTNVQMSWSGPYSISVSNVIGVTNRNFYLQVQSLPAINITSDLAGFWKFDETGSTNAADSSPNGNAGILSSFTDPNSAWLAGQYNNALRFNADASTLNLVAVPDVGAAAPAALDFYSNPAFTLSAWVKGTLPQVNGAGIICRGDGVGEQYALDLPTAGYRFYVRDTNGALFSVTTTILPDGTWQHVAGVFDSANGSMSIYVNGKLANYALPPGNVISTTHELSIGNRQSGAGTAYNRPFTGSIDDVRVYHRALTSSDVQGLYTSYGFDPSITTQPSSLSRAFGQAASFSVVAGGTGPFSYQWYRNDAPLSNGGTISGATSATLNLSSAGIADGGDYRVVVLGASGSRISSATATLALAMTPGQPLYWDSNGTTNGTDVSPVGMWGTDPFWSLDANGAQTTGGWIDGATAVFSAGTEAFSPYTVTLSGPQAVAGLNFEEGTVTLSGSTLTLVGANGQSEISVPAFYSAVVDSVVAGTNAIIKTGDGQVSLNGVNTYTGKTIFKAGTLTASQDNRLGAVPAAAVADALKFDGGTLEWASANNNRALDAKRGVTLTVNGGIINESASGGSAGIIINGIVAGPGKLTKTGPAILTLANSNTFSGGIDVMQGQLRLNSSNIFTSAGWISLAAGSGVITMANGTTIRNNMGFPGPVDPITPASTVLITNRIVLSGGMVTFGPAGSGVQPHVNYTGVISGPGGIIRENVGDKIMILSGANTFSGGVQLQQRALALGNKYALGTGTLSIGDPFTPPANQMRLEAAQSLIGPNAITNPVVFYQQVSLCSAENMPYGLEMSGPIELGNPNVPIYCNQGAGATLVPNLTNIFSGVISSANGYGFTKQGAGTLVLKGANTYAGDTTVGAGTLAVNNTAGTGTGLGNVIITNASVALVGTGTIAGSVTNSLGTISGGPGLNSVGKLTIQNGLDLSTGGTNSWDLAALKDNGTGLAGTDFDQIAITGGSLNLSGATLVLSFTSDTAPNPTNAFWLQAHAWTIISLSGGASNPGSVNFVAIQNATNSAGFFSTTVTSNGSIQLTYTPTAAPVPIIEGMSATVGSASFAWNTATGLNYEVQYKTNLVQPTWLILTNLAGTGSTVNITDNHGGDPMRFYRVVVVP